MENGSVKHGFTPVLIVVVIVVMMSNLGKRHISTLTCPEMYKVGPSKIKTGDETNIQVSQSK